MSCNNIEHFANPIKAVEQWISILKPGGVLIIVAPKKEANFDHNRQIVKFDHLLYDYSHKTGEDDLSHLEEILRQHDLSLDPQAGSYEQFKERSLKNIENRCLHQHVFNLDILQKIFEFFNLLIVNKKQLSRDYVIIGQK